MKTVGTLAIIAVVACSGPQDPRQQIESMMEEAVAAASARDSDAMLAFLSDTYRDDQGRDKKVVSQLVRYQLHQDRSIHLFHRINRIELMETGRARVILTVAMAGSPIEGIEQIGDIQADLFRFDIELVDEGRGEWRIVKGSWNGAMPADFF